MDPFWKDVAQVGSWLAAIALAVVTAYKAIHEIRANRDLRERELLWKKAELAREVLRDIFANRGFRDALTMLDYSGREFEIAPGRRRAVTWEELPDALRAFKEDDEEDGFTSEQVYIRDCFDEFFFALNRLEHYLETSLIRFEDIRLPLAYYMGRLERHHATLAHLMDHPAFPRTHAFIARFAV